MAKNIGLIKISGKVGDLQFFKKGGNAYVKLSSSIDKNRIMKDPAFKRTRENMSEFGGSATTSRLIREKLVPVQHLIETGLHTRLTAMLRDIISLNTGIRGKRPIEFSVHKDQLEGFELNSQSKFREMFPVPIEITTNADRNQLVLTTPEFRPSDYLLVPEGATHFKIHLIGMALSDFGATGIRGKYQAANTDQHGLLAQADTGELALDAIPAGGLNLQIDLPDTPVLDQNVSLTAMIGIEYMQIIGTEYYLFAQNNAIKIAKLFKYD